MKIKIIFIFLLTILIPTSFLAYFGLLSVRNEKSIIEKHMLQKYKAMADIVASEIKSAIAEANFNELFLNQEQGLKSLLLKQAALFQDEVGILDKSGNFVGKGRKENSTLFSSPVFLRPLEDFPYTIAVYERYPVIFAQLEEKRQKIFAYIAIIIFAAVSILSGSSYTLWALAQEWRQAKLKSAFVSQLSHDIRKPLTSIRMFSEMLEEGHLPSEEKKRKYYKIISDESHKLTDLANSILDFTRIEKGRMKYNFEIVDIGNIVKESVERFQIQTQNRRISAEIPEKIFFVKADVHAISQAVMNLLTNADKYSPVDKEIQVKVKSAGSGSKFVYVNNIIIEVADQGIGIPGSEQKKIFQKFYRALKKTGGLQGVEGTGLGLTLVKATMTAHKGKVEVESQEGKGSKFSLIFKKMNAPFKLC